MSTKFLLDKVRFFCLKIFEFVVKDEKENVSRVNYNSFVESFHNGLSSFSKKFELFMTLSFLSF